MSLTLNEEQNELDESRRRHFLQRAKIGNASLGKVKVPIQFQEPVSVQLGRLIRRNYELTFAMQRAVNWIDFDKPKQAKAVLKAAMK